jgi:hypothetical protein
MTCNHKFSRLHSRLNFSCLIAICSIALVISVSSPAFAQSCLSSADMDAAARTALENAAHRYFDMASRGDVASLRQNSIPSLASAFTGIEAAVTDNKAAFAGAQPAARPPFLLEAQGNAPLARAEFLCGVFGANGQTRDSAVFVLPNLPPGKYGIVIMDISGSKGPYTLSLILQQVGTDWKLGGYYAKAAEAGGHDAIWFGDRARQFKAKGQLHNAWLYFLEARDLMAPVPFMSTLQTDKLYDEAQSVLPKDFPASGNPVDLPAGGKTYKLTEVFPLGVGNDVELVVKYQTADISNSAQTFQNNMAVIKGLVAKYPELRDAFSGVVARAVEPSGRDYGSLLAMKDIK